MNNLFNMTVYFFWKT